MALASSSKHIIQIIQLLEERRMSFSICLNKNELLLLAGFGLLFQGLNLDRKGKLIQDSQRLLCSVIEILERIAAPGATEFKKIVCAMISIERFSKNARTLDEAAVRRKPSNSMPAPKSVSKSGRKFQAIASRFSTSGDSTVKREGCNVRRATAPTLLTGNSPVHDRSNSQNSLSSVKSDPLSAQCPKRISISQSPQQVDSLQPPNLDYLSFNNDSSPNLLHGIPHPGGSTKTYDQDQFHNSGLGLEGQPLMDSMFPSTDVFSSYISPTPSNHFDWGSDVWNVAPDLGHQAAKSRVSFSEEELTSGEELSNCESGGEIRGMAIPAVNGLTGLEGLEGGFGL